MPVGHIPRSLAQRVLREAPGLVKPQVFSVLRLGQIEDEAPRILIALQSAFDQGAPLHHLQGHQTVEVSEGRVLDEPGHRIGAGEPGSHLIGQPLLQLAPGLEQLWHLSQGRDLLLFCEIKPRVQAKDSLQHFLDLARQDLAGLQSAFVNG